MRMETGSADGDDAESRGVQFLKALGLPEEVAASTLRALPVDSLLSAMKVAPASAPTMPVVDGVLLREQPATAFARGAYTRTPILTGSTEDEFALFMPPNPLEPAEYREWVEQSYTSNAAALLRAYPPGTDAESTRRERLRLLTDQNFRAPMLFLLELTGGNSQVFLYRFGWRPDDGAVGAFHSSDLSFLFDTHGWWWSTGQDVRMVTQAMQRAWARFAAVGTPAVSGEYAHWQEATADYPVVMVIDTDAQLELLPRLDAVRLFSNTLANRLRDSRGGGM
jgi:para-nitrobenzyl esterase